MQDHREELGALQLLHGQPPNSMVVTELGVGTVRSNACQGQNHATLRAGEALSQACTGIPHISPQQSSELLGSRLPGQECCQECKC